MNDKPFGSTLILSNSAWSISNYRPWIIEELSETSAVCTVAVSDPDALDGFMQATIRANKRKIVVNNVSTSIFSNLMSFFSVAYAFWRVRPDLIFSFTTKVNIFSAICARIFGSESVITVTGLGIIYSRRSAKYYLIRRLYIFSLSLADRIVVQNERDYRYLRCKKSLKDKRFIQTNGSGVNTKIFFISNDRLPSKNVVFAARALPEKGVEDFIEAASMFKQNATVNFTIRLFTTNASEQAYKSKIELACQAANINFEEFSEDIIPFLRGAWVLVLPTRLNEGVPKIMLEALSLGVPVIFSDTASLRAFHKKFEIGMMYPKGSKEKLCDRILEVIRLNDDEYKALRSYYAAVARHHFDFCDVKKKYLS